MKKIFTLVAAALTAASFSANAETLVSDNFEYPVGNLLNAELTNGNWMHYNTQTGGLIQVVNSPLTKAGYQNTAVGGAVKLAAVANGQDAMVKMADKPIVAETGKTLYAAFLMNVESMPAASTFSFSFLAPGTTSYTKFVDGGTPSEIGRMSILAGTSEETFVVGVSRNSNMSIAKAAQELNFGETYLVVLSYEWVEGDKNDAVKVFINPTPNTDLSAPFVKANDTGADAKQIQAFEFRQPAANASGPNLLVDALRITDSWDDIFPQEPITGVNDLNVEKTNSVCKYIENGQVVIEKNGVKYNIAGQAIK